MRKLLIWIGMTCLVMGGGFACKSSPVTDLNPVQNLINQFNITSIDQLLQTKPQNAVVTLRGKVQTIAPLVGNAVYQLEDASGSIWILTSNPELPKVGDILLVKGQTRYELILLGGQDRGELYIQEQEILERQPPPARPLGTNLLPNNSPSP